MDNLLDSVVVDQSARERLGSSQKFSVSSLLLIMASLLRLKAAEVFQRMVDVRLTAFAFRPDIVFCSHHAAIALPFLC